MDYRQLYPDLMRKYNMLSFGGRPQGEHRALPENTGILGAASRWISDPQRPERQVAFGGFGNWADKVDKGQQTSYIDRAFASLDMLPGVDDIAAKGLLGVATAAGPAWMGKRMAQGGVSSGGALGRQRGIIGGESGLADEYAPTREGIFKSEHAPIDRKDMLDLAKAQEGKLPPDKLFDATGWWRGMDGKWRSEIDDSQALFPLEHMKTINPRAEYTARAVGEMPEGWTPGDAGTDKMFTAHPPAVVHPTLAQAYRTMEKMPVRFSPNQLPRNTRGEYSPLGGSGNYVTGRVAINTAPGAGADNSTVLHELQHSVQNREGFSSGSNPESATSALRAAATHQESQRMAARHGDEYKKAFNVYQNVNEKLMEKVRKGEITHEQYYKLDDELERKLGEKYPEYGMATRPSRVPHISQDPWQNYKRVAGEVEARNVQKRQHLSPDDRRMLAPWMTEDVLPANQFAVDSRGGLYSPELSGGIYAEALRQMGMM